MKPNLIRQEARLLAIEYMVTHVYNSLLMIHKVAENDIEKIERHSLALAERYTFDNVDPATSDHAAAEIRDSGQSIRRGKREASA